MSTTPPDQPIDDLAARLERERLDADRQYNDALTALDRAVPADGTDAQREFQTKLILFLQKITAFVESKDRAVGGSELREEIVRARARTLELQRAVEQLATSGASAGGETGAAAPRGVAGATYIGFEDQFRGTREQIRARLADYMPIFAGMKDVLDVGCGRGELLDLFRAHGIDARGVDMNGAMVDACRERGLEATTGDAVSYLEALPDGSLGGLIAIQVVEHLDPPVLVRFLETAFLKMRPGAPIVLETINAACWMAFFETYIRDLTHARPLHPDTLKFLVQASGFSHSDVRFRAPVVEQDRLPRVDAAAVSAELAPIVHALNAHADQLNARLFSAMDYAVVARR